MDLEGSFRSAAGHVTVLEELREVVSHFQVVAWNEARPWSEFCDNLAPNKVVEAAPLAVELLQKVRSGSKSELSTAINQDSYASEALVEQVSINLWYYRVNYVFLSLGLVFCGALLFNTALVGVALGALGGGFYLFHLRRRRRIVVRGRRWSNSDKAYCLFASSCIGALCLGALKASIGCVLLAGLMIGAHVVMRPKSTRSRFSSLGKDASLELGGVETRDVGFSDSVESLAPQHSFAPQRDVFGVSNGSGESNSSGSIETHHAAHAVSTREEEERRFEYERQRIRNSDYAKRRAAALKKRFSSGGTSASTVASSQSRLSSFGSSLESAASDGVFVSPNPAVEEEESKQDADLNERQASQNTLSKQVKMIPLPGARSQFPGRSIPLKAAGKQD